jgi:hypothetical protein
MVLSRTPGIYSGARLLMKFETRHPAAAGSVSSSFFSESKVCFVKNSTGIRHTNKT